MNDKIRMYENWIFPFGVEIVSETVGILGCYIKNGWISIKIRVCFNQRQNIENNRMIHCSVNEILNIALLWIQLN